MAIKGISATAVKLYVPKDDPLRGPKGEPIEGSTYFKIKSLNGFEKAIIRDSSMSVETVPDPDPDKAAKGVVTIKMTDNPGLFKQAYQTLRMGLLGWSNLTDDKDQEIRFETETIDINGRKADVPAWACLERVPPGIAVETMLEILSFNEVSKDDGLKSGAVSLPVNSIQNGNVAPAMPTAEVHGAVSPKDVLDLTANPQVSG